MSVFSWTASLKPLRDILPLFLITRLIIIAAIYLPLLFHLYIYPVSSSVYQGTPLLDPLARWDAEWYLRIADQGYRYTPRSVVQTESYTGFFPLYPLLVRVTGQLTGDPLVGGLLISSASFLAALVYLYHLQALWYSKEEAGQAIWYLMVFPTSFFFSMAYTESLFFLLTVMAAYYARRQRWLIAAALTGLAGACRMPGVLMLIIIGYEWALTKGWSLGTIRSRAAWSALVAGLWQDAGRLLLVIALAVSGVVAYLVYLAVTY
ncbi:MAG: glycosyltransferase family 39 protein, partial [Anaerolineae bacterium]|nr:glycosyltransferase family 39 protein [Anaerolineae bacterium]